MEVVKVKKLYTAGKYISTPNSRLGTKSSQILQAIIVFVIVIVLGSVIEAYPAFSLVPELRDARMWTPWTYASPVTRGRFNMG